MAEVNSKTPISKRGNAASPGSGQVHTTGLFRLLNFERYAKPNKVVMIPGVILFMGCVGYLTYLNLTEDRERKTYMALNEQGVLVKRSRTSRWD